MAIDKAEELGLSIFCCKSSIRVTGLLQIIFISSTRKCTTSHGPFKVEDLTVISNIFPVIVYLVITSLRFFFLVRLSPGLAIRIYCIRRNDFPDHIAISRRTSNVAVSHFFTGNIRIAEVDIAVF